MGRKHYTKAELSKKRRANAFIAKMDEASLNAALIPGPYIKNESLAVFEDTIAAYNNLKFHFLTEMDKPILEAYADAVAYWRFYKRAKDDALSEFNHSVKTLLISGENAQGSHWEVPTTTAATIAYCEKQLEIYFRRMMAARDHLSLSPLQLAKFIKAMQEIEDERAKKDQAKNEDPIANMFGDSFSADEVIDR